MDIPHFSRGVKPMKMKFLGALKLLQGKPSDTCVIGDQLFTDIFGGNRCGLHTILVDPICRDEFMTTRWLRRIEDRIRGKLSYEGEIMKVE
jgi:HAD superfamily phosphatase (TIGR01668 family)